MLSHDIRITCPECPGSFYIVSLFDAEGLASHQARRTGPSGQSQDEDDIGEFLTDDGGEGEHQRKRRDHHERFRDSHKYNVKDAAIVARYNAEGGSHHRDQQGDEKADHKRGSGSVDQRAEDVSAHFVKSEEEGRDRSAKPRSEEVAVVLVFVDHRAEDGKEDEQKQKCGSE